MAALNLTKGEKMQLAFDVPIGETPEFNMICTFSSEVDESAFLISIPMKGGSPLPVDETQKFLFKYAKNGEEMVLAGYVDGEVKQGIRRYWQVRRVEERRQFVQRRDERFKLALRIQYMQDTWHLNEDGKIDKEDAMTLDISAGGIAMFLNNRFDVGELIHISFPRMGTMQDGATMEDVVATVCWMREAPKGSIYRNVCGVQFRYGDGAEREKMQDYIEYMKKRFKLG